MTAKFSASSDGTKVNIGNAAEDGLQIDSTAKTISAVAPYVIDGRMLGVDQTWKTSPTIGSRALGVIYTNITGKPITVAVTISSPAGRVGVSLTVDGVLIGYAYAVFNETQGTLFGIVPPGGTYAVDGILGGPVLNSWAELTA